MSDNGAYIILLHCLPVHQVVAIQFAQLSHASITCTSRYVYTRLQSMTGQGQGQGICTGQGNQTGELNRWDLAGAGPPDWCGIGLVRCRLCVVSWGKFMMCFKIWHYHNLKPIVILMPYHETHVGLGKLVYWPKKQFFCFCGLDFGADSWTA